MKVFMATRLMSGFVESLHTREWCPSGSPAIYKLIDQLIQHGHQLTLCWLVKEPGNEPSSDWQLNQEISLRLKQLDADIYVIPGMRRIPRLPKKIRYYLSQWYQGVKVIRHVLQDKPDVVYIDRAHVLLAALLKRIFKQRVFLRILGVTPAMNALMNQRNIRSSIMRWAYRSRFDYVLCSMDGSNARAWLARCIHSDTPYSILLNGNDMEPAVIAPIVKERNKLRVLLLGRLEPNKQPLILLNSVVALSSVEQERLSVTIIGEGSLYTEIAQFIKDHQLEQIITLVGAVPHHKVRDYLHNHDVYVSLNEQGNLSNANLEALKSGLVMVLLEPTYLSTDSDSYQVMATGTAVRLDTTLPIQSLASTLVTLLSYPQLVETYKEASLENATKVRTWKMRIKDEIELIEAIAHRSHHESVIS